MFALEILHHQHIVEWMPAIVSSCASYLVLQELHTCNPPGISIPLRQHRRFCLRYPVRNYRGCGRMDLHGHFRGCARLFACCFRVYLRTTPRAGTGQYRSPIAANSLFWPRRVRFTPHGSFPALSFWFWPWLKWLSASTVWMARWVYHSTVFTVLV